MSNPNLVQKLDPRSLVLRPDWISLRIAWRARYQQGRHILEKYMPSLLRFNETYPSLFDENEEEGKARWEQVKKWLDDGDTDNLKIFINEWQPVILEKQRAKLRQEKQ